MLKKNKTPLKRQKGVAVVTALLLTTLAITIVASLFWQQQVQVRSIENQRFQLQKKWILRGALDWATLILREDARGQKVDYLGEPWAVNLGDTKLDQYVENGKLDGEESDATLTGQISDEQSKYNINNLAFNGVIDEKEIAVFSKLLKNLQLDGSLAQKAAIDIAATQTKFKQDVDGETDPANTVESKVQFLSFNYIEDLLSVSGFSSEIIEKLKPFVTVLPKKSKINVNTTTAEVLSARLENVSLADAASIIAQRDRAYYRNFNDLKNNFPTLIKDSETDFISCETSYFVVNGKVKLNRSNLEVHALIYREDLKTQILWVKES